MAASAGEESDGSATMLAVLRTDIKHLTTEVIRRLDKLDDRLEGQDQRIVAGEIRRAELGVAVKALDEDVGALKRESRGWNTINSIVAAIAGVVAGLRQ